MAVRLEGAIHRYIGLSGDLKPTTLTPAFTNAQGQIVAQVPAPPAGSSFLETDTGRMARFDGKRWIYDADESATTHLLSDVLSQLHRIDEHLEIISGKL